MIMEEALDDHGEGFHTAIRKMKLWNWQTEKCYTEWGKPEPEGQWLTVLLLWFVALNIYTWE